MLAMTETQGNPTIHGPLAGEGPVDIDIAGRRFTVSANTARNIHGAMDQGEVGLRTDGAGVVTHWRAGQNDFWKPAD